MMICTINKFKLYFHYWLMLCLFLSESIVSASDQQVADTVLLDIPMGVDSLLVKDCALMSDTLFISIEDEKAAEESFSEAKELLKTISAMQECMNKLSADLDEQAILAEMNDLDLPLTFKVKCRRILVNEEIEKVIEWIREEINAGCQQVDLQLQDVCQMNPFHMGAGVERVKLLLKLAKEKSSDEEKKTLLESAMSELERLLPMDQSNHYLYSLKGEIEIELDDWESAKQSYYQATDFLFDYAFLPSDLSRIDEPVSVDTTVVFKYLLYLVQAHVKLYESDRALVQIERAESFARNEEGRELLNTYRDMINWADGDIRSRELFVEATAFEDKNDFSESAGKYHEILKRMDSSLSEAYIETSYRLSLLEYKHFKKDRSYLKKYGAQNIGMGRLRKIIRRLNQDQYGTPQDSLSKNYFEIFGTMLFNEGILAIENNFQSLAMSYFLQGALFKSSYQAKSSLELAKLVMHHGDIGVRWALHAYSKFHDMTEDEKQQLYPLLRFVTKRANQPELCQYFHEEFRSFLHPEAGNMNRKIRLMGYEFLRYGFVDLKHYCETDLDIEYNPSSIRMYEQKYVEEESALPKSMKIQIRSLIQESYQNRNQADAIKSWKSFTNQIPL